MRRIEVDEDRCRAQARSAILLDRADREIDAAARLIVHLRRVTRLYLDRENPTMEVDG